MLLTLFALQRPSSLFVSQVAGPMWRVLRVTHRSWPVKHSHTKVPKAKPTILSDTAEAVVLVVASPRIESYGSDPRVVTLTARNDRRL